MESPESAGASSPANDSQRRDILDLIHDLNNELGIIVSFSGFVREAAGDQGPMAKDVEEVLSAAHRAVDLSRKLHVVASGEEYL